MKKMVILALVGLMIVGGIGTVQASSDPNFPTAVRVVNPLGTWTGTASNPEYVTYSPDKTDTVDVVSEVTLLKAGTVTGVVNPVTVVQPTGSNLHTVIDSGIITTVEKILAGTLTGIVNDVGIKDNGNSITIDTPQLPSALDVSGNLKVAQQGTVNVKLDSNINTPLGKVKITDGTTDVAVTTEGRLKVETPEQAGTDVGRYGENTAVASGGTADLITYTIAGGTFYLTSINATADSDATFVVRWGTATQTFDTAGSVNNLATIKTSSIMKTTVFPLYQGISVANTNKVFVRVYSNLTGGTQFASVNLVGKVK